VSSLSFPPSTHKTHRPHPASPSLHEAQPPTFILEEVEHEAVLITASPPSDSSSTSNSDGVRSGAKTPTGSRANRPKRFSSPETLLRLLAKRMSALRHAEDHDEEAAFSDLPNGQTRQRREWNSLVDASMLKSLHFEGLGLDFGQWRYSGEFEGALDLLAEEDEGSAMSDFGDE